MNILDKIHAAVENEKLVSNTPWVEQPYTPEENHIATASFGPITTGLIALGFAGAIAAIAYLAQIIFL